MQTTFNVIRNSSTSKAFFTVSGLTLALAATLPLWGESSWMREFVEIACYLIFAMMWNLLAGYGGMVSIGQQAFFGLGGYVMLVCGNFAGINPFIAILIGALVAGLLAIPISWVAFRLQGRAAGIAAARSEPPMGMDRSVQRQREDLLEF